MNTYTPEEEILARGRADWVDFSEVYWLVEKWSLMRSLDPHQEVARLLRHLLSDGLVRAGTVERGAGFVAWDLDESESVDRILREWSSLGREPHLGEVCWLANTPAGDALATEVLADADPSKRWISEIDTDASIRTARPDSESPPG
jgi:hypothetical protein